MKTLLMAFFAASILTAFSQDTTGRAKVYRNEFGIECTGFLKQFLNLNQQFSYYYYSPEYYLTYRRHFKSGNLRAALAGSFSDQELSVGFSPDSNQYHNTVYSINSRLGWELFDQLSKRWEVYYGLDLRQEYSYVKNDAPYWSGGYANGVETRSQTYGIGPLLGLRFKLTNRFCLSTETGFFINRQQEYSRRYYIPVNSQFPVMPDVVNPRSVKIFSTFVQPLSLFVTFDI